MPARPFVSSETAYDWVKAPQFQAWLFVTIVCSAMFGLTAWRAQRAYDLVLDGARVTTANLARSLADHAHATVQTSDIIVSGLADRLHSNGVAPEALASMHSMMMSRVATLPIIHHLVIFSAQGDALTASLEPMPQRNVADRDYFIHHRDHPDGGAFIGPPMRNRADGLWSVMVSRRFNQPDGSFGGVVVAVIDCATFARFYDSFDVGPHGVITLIDKHRSVLVREPPLEGAIGSSRRVAVDWWVDGKATNGEGVSPLDGVTRLYSAHRADDYGLMVVVAVSINDVLAGWWLDTWEAFFATFAVAAAIVLLGWRLVRQIRMCQQREIAIRHSEEQHRLLAAHTSDAITCLDTELRRTYVSAGFERLFGYNVQDAVGTLAASTVHPDDASSLAAQMRRISSGEVDHDVVTNRVAHKDGHWVWVEKSLQLVRDATGQPASIICAIRDVTTRKRAEIAVAEASRWLALAEHVAGLGHWRFEPLSERLHWSTEVYRIHGLDPDLPPTLQQALDAYHPDDRHIVKDAIGRAVAEHTGYDITLRLVRADGEIRHVQSRAVVELRADGEVSALFGVLLDITEQVNDQAAKRDRDERERRAMEAANSELERLAGHLAEARDKAERTSLAKSRFLAGMSHELRTPLNGMLGYAQLLNLEGGLTPKQSLRVGAMLGAGQHLLEMINRVLDLSEIEAERVQLHPIIFNLNQAMTTCLDLVRPAADAKQLALTLHTAPDVPRDCMLDPTLLRQMMLNLIGNAVKFTARGAIELRLLVAGGGSKLRIEVADSGPGIPTERRPRLFQEFERLGVDEVAPTEGAGLGLALSARLAELMEGQIGYAENPTGGSLFWLELPLLSGDAALHAFGATASTTSPVDQATQSRPVGAEPLRVLLVDDVSMNRDVAGSFLQAGAYHVTYAQSGAEAVAAAAADDFAIILMDVRMPRMDGMEATQRIRALAGPRGRVPIVALTAQAFAEQVKECREAGMDGHLTKPFTPEALLSTVAKAIEGGRARVASDISGQADTPSDEGAGEESVKSVAGSELQVFDSAAFEQTASYVAPAILAGYLQTVAERGEELISLLQSPPETIIDLADAAHTLAGSAGMFGFDRIAGVARLFERGLRADAPDCGLLAEGLDAAIVASLPELQARLRAAETACSEHQPA